MSLDIALLSIIQGVSEILPISSSVNLHLFSKLFNISNFTFSLKIALHAGSLITLIIYFRQEFIDILRGIFSSRKKITSTFLPAMLFGTLPVVITGFLCRDFVKEFNSPKIMGISCIFFGILLLVFDKLSCAKTRSDRNPISAIKAFIIGCFQSVAIFPGVSRLGICITAARMLGIDRKKAIYVSLLLAIPSICGSLTLELVENYKTGTLQSFTNDAILGILLTSMIGLLAIWQCVKFMEKRGFFALVIYRIIIGALICFI